MERSRCKTCDDLRKYIQMELTENGPYPSNMCYKNDEYDDLTVEITGKKVDDPDTYISQNQHHNTFCVDRVYFYSEDTNSFYTIPQLRIQYFPLDMRDNPNKLCTKSWRVKLRVEKWEEKSRLEDGQEHYVMEFTENNDDLVKCVKGAVEQAKEYYSEQLSNIEKYSGMFKED